MMIHDGIELPDGRALGFDGAEIENGRVFSAPDSKMPCLAWRVSGARWRDASGAHVYHWSGDPADVARIDTDPSGALSPAEVAANAADAVAYRDARRAEIREAFHAAGKRPAAWAPSWLQ